MTTREDVIAVLKRESEALKREFGVKRIALFGSFADNTQTERSDVDIVVELKSPIGLKFLDLVDRFEKLLGRKTDVLTYNALKAIRVGKVAKAIKGSLVYV